MIWKSTAYYNVLHPTFDWDSPALKETWAKFEQCARLMFVGSLSDKTEVQKVSYLLLWIGEKGRDICLTFHYAPGRVAVAATNDVPAAPASPAED